MKTRDVYTGIADSTRREILTVLLQREVATAGEISAAFPDMSQPAISRHLRVLRECDLVQVVRSGKTQNYAVNAEPINDLRNGWLSAFADLPTRSLTTLRKLVEG